MDSGTLTSSVTNFVQNHAALAIGIVTVFGVLTYLKPKEMFKLTMAVLVLGAIVFVGMFLVDLTSTGIDETNKFMGNLGGK